MSREKLERWADLLLDTGKRNNLVNFRDLKMGSLEILLPEFSVLFEKAEHSATVEVFDPKIEDEEDLYIDPSWLPEQIPVAPKKDFFTKEEFFDKFSKKVKKNQVLAYTASGDPIRALRNLRKRARSAIEETGVNVLYLAFGFIEWSEDDGKTKMKAPILLAPVTVQNESAAEPFKLIISDDIILNPTFAFKMLNEYGVKLPEYEDDIELDELFSALETSVARLGWKVIRECKLGLFSFLKINMYRDLKENADKILLNDDVRVILGEADGDLSPVSVPDDDLLDQYNVVDADSSQLEAIETARLGRSFVLQGPPGTGKSQTITNIIAECLASGKRVLFVSEKLAALNVVYNKLHSVGLEEFCLQLHSHKASKKEVIKDLCTTLKMPKSGVAERAKKETEARDGAREKLDKYVEELHKIRDVIGCSLYELYEEFTAYRDVETPDFVIEQLKLKGALHIEATEGKLKSYADFVKRIGFDYHDNAWYGFDKKKRGYDEAMRVKKDLEELRSICESAIEFSREIGGRYAIRVQNINQATAWLVFFRCLNDCDCFTPAVLVSDAINRVEKGIETLERIANDCILKKKRLDEKFYESVYAIDGATVLDDLLTKHTNPIFRLFNKEYKGIVANLRASFRSGNRINYALAIALARELKEYQLQVEEFAKAEAPLSEFFRGGYKGLESNFTQMKAEISALKTMRSQMRKAGLSTASVTSLSKEEYETERAHIARFVAEYGSVFEPRAEVVERLSSDFSTDEFDVCGVPVSELLKKCEGCLAHIRELDDWCAFKELLVELADMDLLKFVNFSIEQKLNEDTLVSVYKKLFYAQWIDCVWYESPELDRFSRVPHDEAVELFKQKDELNFDINKAKINALLSSVRPSLDMVAHGSAISVLLREGEKKRKQKGIRVLLSEIGELVQTLKPCFLMSPLSVSTFLSPDMKFDVVVFDEASQIFPQDALGAIYRGKQLIVVGDSMQMPPSNFFSTTVESEDEDEEDVTDFESILDLCSSAFPQRRLKWHYRSRFEELISFSNKNFYDSDLVTFPSAKTDSVGSGVDYYYVDGVFDRKTKTNFLEAEKVVELVFKNMEEYPDRSIGVVAFSISQQALIERLIARKRGFDPSKDKFFRSDIPEPFFVKNLETVQGDERDTIIFSVAYAKDASGKLYMNFGPINREGGERRLNVAVTRAKCNVQLVSSMHSADIDLTRTKSVGAKLMKEYLDYAENGVSALDGADVINPFLVDRSELKSEIYEFLRSEGYEADMDLGNSEYKIDLAVKAVGADSYALAIELDGEGYRDSKNTRDRDRLRETVLERMGWTFYRLWSTDWIKNEKSEKMRLLDAVKKAVGGVGVFDAGIDPTGSSFEEVAPEKHFAFPKYEFADFDKIVLKYGKDLLGFVKEVMEVEAPISSEWLLTRIAKYYGFTKVATYMRDQFERAVKAGSSYGIVKDGEFLYFKDREIPMLRVPEDGATTVREIKLIPTSELAVGLKELLKRNVTAEKSGIYKFLCSQLGYPRMIDTITKRFDEALATLGSCVEIDGDKLSYKG